MKDKNLILIIGIVLIWLFIIRPLGDKKQTVKTGATPAPSTNSLADSGEDLKNFAESQNDYVKQSIKNNEKQNVSAVEEYPLRTYTA